MRCKRCRCVYVRAQVDAFDIDDDAVNLSRYIDVELLRDMIDEQRNFAHIKAEKRGRGFGKRMSKRRQV